MVREEKCVKCGGVHAEGPCPVDSRSGDVELQAVFSGRRGHVELPGEVGKEPEGEATASPGRPEAQEVRPPALHGVVSIESLLTHPDPFISSLAAQLRARDSMLEAVRSAAQQAVEQTRRRERELDDRESRIRDLSETLRSREAEIAARERALEDRVSRTDREVGVRMRELRERELDMEKREMELAAARDAFEAEVREREMEQGAREERARDVESFGRTPARAGPKGKEHEVDLPVSYVGAGQERVAMQPEFIGMTVATKGKESPAAELLRLRSDLRRERARIVGREENMMRRERELEDLALRLAEREARLQEAEKKWPREVERAARSG